MLTTLLDRAQGEVLPLGPGLEVRYGGPLRMPERSVFANFVSTVDGIVSYGVPGIAAARFVSEGYPGDRFVLALLRAAADAVIVGAGTLRNEPKSVWTPASVLPDEADAFAAMRRAMGRPAAPFTIIVSARGEIDLSLPVFHSGVPVIIATTHDGRRRIGAATGAVEVRDVVVDGPIPMGTVVDLAIDVSGGTRILTEGGPTILGSFLSERVLDELFLTIAPRIAGRSVERRGLGLVEGAAFLPKTAPAGRLVGLKSGDDYLFTRYAFARD